MCTCAFPKFNKAASLRRLRSFSLRTKSLFLTFSEQTAGDYVLLYSNDKNAKLTWCVPVLDGVVSRASRSFRFSDFCCCLGRFTYLFDELAAFYNRVFVCLNTWPTTVFSLTLITIKTLFRFSKTQQFVATHDPEPEGQNAEPKPALTSEQSETRISRQQATNQWGATFQTGEMIRDLIQSQTRFLTWYTVHLYYT